MPITLNHSNIGVQYNTGSNYIIETVKSDLYIRNEIYDTIVSNNLQAAPVTPIVSIQDGSNIYAVESYTYSGTANTADFTRVFPKNTVCDILIVGGGGAGDRQIGGGGGGGAVLYATNITIPANTYTIKVGKGGENGNGGNSEAFGATCLGGGSTPYVAWGTANNGTAGGSGSGASPGSSSGGAGGGVGTSTKGTLLNSGTLYNGNVGGNALSQVSGTYQAGGGGGGGAGTAGLNSTQTLYTTRSSWIAGGRPSSGGDGVQINITGTTYYWGAGGGGAGHAAGNVSHAGDGGLGGGGGGGAVAGSIAALAGTGGINSGSNGLNTGTENGGNGAPNTGSGGGGGAYNGGSVAYNGGNGGSGIVIIRYLLGTIPSTNLLTSEPTVISPVMTETVRSFVHSGGTEAQTTHTITVGQNTICDILIIGGGGGGGNGDSTSVEAGGGGAGGIVYMVNKTLSSGTYKINVGKGGSANTNGNNSTITYNNNNTLTFDSILLIGKGGGKGATTSSQTGSDGGSGGGGGNPQTNGGLATQGNTFWNGSSYVAGGYNGGKASANSLGAGGGGAGELGNTDGAGFGGDGVQVNITGVNTFYAGGGNAFPNTSTTRSDGGGGTLNGTGSYQNGGNALPDTGSGGSGAYNGGGSSGGAGGSGIVIIKFKSITNAGILDGITHKRLNFAYNIGDIVAYYKFNGNYQDSNLSNTKYDLSPFGTPEFQTSRFIEGQSVLINADNEYLATSVNFPNQFGMTYSFWFLLDVMTANRIIFAIGADFFIMIQPQVNRFYMSNTMAGNETYTQPSFTFSANTWYHLVLMFLSNGTWKLYMNGVDLNINALNGTYPLTAAKLPTGKLFIGGKNIGYWYDVFHRGNVDEFYVFNKELTQTEITNLYNKTYSLPINTYTLNFPVPTIADINNNSNIVLRGAYDIALSTSNALIIPKSNQYIPKPTTFSTSNISVRYNLLNPVLDPAGAQLTYNTSNTNVYHMGSVGIGTKSPEYNLDINGSLNANTYYFNGVQIGRLSEGMVANVQHLTYTHMEVKNNTGWDAINDDLTTGFVISITPKSNLSKILVNLIAHIGLTSTNDGRWWGLKLYRKIGTAAWTEITGPNGTETGSAATTAGTPVWISNNIGTTSSSYPYQIINLTGTYLDSPNTTSIVYYTAYWNQRIGDNPSGTAELWLNRAANQNDAYRPAPSSSWTIKEIWYG